MYVPSGTIAKCSCVTLGYHLCASMECIAGNLYFYQWCVLIHLFQTLHSCTDAEPASSHNDAVENQESGNQNNTIVCLYNRLG